jgi:hypothetical protein
LKASLKFSAICKSIFFSSISFFASLKALSPKLFPEALVFSGEKARAILRAARSKA